VLWAHRRLQERAPPSVPHSDGTVERAGADVMHFAFQYGFLTEIPSIYHPHDLQHVHLPEFFDARERARRELVYGTLCRRAEMVAVTSSWVKRDVVEHYRLAEEKVRVIPWAPVVGSYEEPSREDLVRIREKLALPDGFALLPAQTWPHKNHLGLVRAIARIRDRHGVAVPVVCSGRTTDHHRKVLDEATRLGVPGALTFVGFVSPLELQALYRLARCVVIPTLFEAASFPLWEAFANGVAAACSNVTSLPEQAGDAALVFDPHDTDAMADAVYRLWTDDALRSTLAARGRERVSRFSWERTARTFRAHYRRIAGRPPTDEDRRLLAAESPL
jgi:glycosyltransferase involved in cell wall biosynthesis